MAKTGLGIIGCGNIGPVHADAISQIRKAKLVAVSDVVETSAQALAGKYGATPYTDYREMIARKDIEAVCLCVPSGLRAEIAEVCAAAGKRYPFREAARSDYQAHRSHRAGDGKGRGDAGVRVPEPLCGRPRADSPGD